MFEITKKGRFEMTKRCLRSVWLCAVLLLVTGPGCGDENGGGASVWLVTYDLTGSTYLIDAMVDFTITVQEPYDEDLNMGPGTMTLRFLDDAGAPAPGAAAMVEYSLTQNFVMDLSMVGVSVTTDLQTGAGPDQSGVAQGELAAGTLTWSPAEAAPHCRDGQVSCVGSLCGSSGLPPEGDPLVFQNDCTEPLPLNPFVFTNGVSNFTMEAVVLAQDANQTVSLSFIGTETDRKRVSAP